MVKQKVLFVCVHNSARSQMAEAYLKQMAPDQFEVESAGLEPGALNPLVVEAMKEEGIDISGNSTDSVFEFFKQGRIYNYVITVCDQVHEQRCPIFPSALARLHWGFDDPSQFEGTREEKLEKIRKVRNAIKLKLREWLQTLN